MVRVDIPIRTTGARKAQSDFKKMGKEIGSMASKYMSLAGASYLFLKTGKDMVDLIKKSEGVLASFKQLNDPYLLDDLRKATKGTISDLQLMTLSMQAKNFQIPLDKFAGSMAYLHGIARQTGKEVKDLASMMLLMLGRESTMRLDEVGIGLIEFNKKLKETGTFADTAFAVMEEKLKAMPEDISELSDQFDIASVAIDNFQLNIIESFGNLFMAAEKTHNLMDKFNTMLGLGEAIIEKFDWRLGPAGLTKTTILYFASLHKGIDVLPKLKEKWAADRDAANKAGDAIDKVKTEYEKWVEKLEAAQRLEAQELEFWRTYATDMGLIATEILPMLNEEVAKLNVEFDNQLKPMKKIHQEMNKFAPQLGELSTNVQKVGNQLISTFDYIFTESLVRGQNFFDSLSAGFTGMLNQMLAELMAKAVIFSAASIFGLGGILSGGKGMLSYIMGFQHGGSFTVGGSGGPDSQMVAFKASPGERVSVTPESHNSYDNSVIISMPNVRMIDKRTIADLDKMLFKYKRLGG